MLHLIWILLPLLFLSAGPAAPAAAAEERVSGTVVRVDRAAGALVIEELTAAATAAPATAQRRFTVGPDTTVVLVHRVAESRDGWPHGYAATPLALDDLRRGDFVTVTVARAGERRLAREISVVRPEADAPTGTGRR